VTAAVTPRERSAASAGLRAKVAAALDSLDRGEGVDGDAAIDEILGDESRAG
jgi:hypothetical protein